MSQSLVLLSYWPLLDPTRRDHSPESLAEILQDKSYPTGDASSCVWAYGPDDSIHPVLVIDKARAIAEHLIAWSEGKPQDWFKLYLHYHEDNLNSFAIVLHPILKKTIERYRVSQLHHHETMVPADTQFQIIYRTLSFGTHNSTNFRYVKDRLPKTISFSLLDAESVDPDDLSGMSNSLIALGEFDIIRPTKDDAMIYEYVDSYLKNLIVPL